MSKNCSEESKALGVHPSMLLLRLGKLGAPFEACWPDIDDDWLLTIREIISGEEDNRYMDTKVKDEDKTRQESRVVMQISDNACKILEKLWRKSFWGDNYVSPASARKMTGLSEPEYKQATRELIEHKFIIVHKESGKAISLETHKKGEIDEIMAIVVYNPSD